MPEVRRVIARLTQRWLSMALLFGATLLTVVACSAAPPAAPAPQVIADKGTPYGDLLVPELQASVTDGAIGVSVDTPITVTAGDGVLGAVSLINEAGRPVTGQMGSDGTTWSSAEPLGYNKQYTLIAEALGTGRGCA